MAKNQVWLDLVRIGKDSNFTVNTLKWKTVPIYNYKIQALQPQWIRQNWKTHFFLQFFMWHGTFLAELWSFCGELILPNFPLHQVVYPWGSIDVGFQYGAWFTAMHATVPLIRNSNHMSFCDLLLCSATGFINKVERSFPP